MNMLDSGDGVWDREECHIHERMGEGAVRESELLSVHDGSLERPTILSCFTGTSLRKHGHDIGCIDSDGVRMVRHDSFGHLTGAACIIMDDRFGWNVRD